MLEEITYHGWEACRLLAGDSQIILVTSIGPRILHASIAEGDNLLAQVPEQMGQFGEAEWKIRGGHRLWHAPEDPRRTYCPDNLPVVRSLGEISLGVTQPVETETGLEKHLHIEVVGRNVYRITHTLTNKGCWTVECAAWALTVLRHGGYAVVPWPEKGQHPRDLLPRLTIVPWTYTDLSLPLWQFRPHCLGLDVKRSVKPQKIGLGAGYPGWSAYWQEAGTLAKFAPLIAGATYPDFGCAFETFANDWMIELETLSPLTRLAPGHSLRHVEYWGLFSGLPKPDTEEAYLEGFLPPLQEWLKRCQDLAAGNA